MNTELLKRLAAAGTPIELVAEVAAEMGRLEGECSALDKRRAGERRRKHEQREREAMSRDVTGQDVTGRDNAEAPSPLTPPLKVSPDPFKESPPLTPQPVCVVKARDRYHRLPEGWVPTRPLPAKTQSKVDLWPPGAIEDELAALHRWAANASNDKGKGRKLDWDKAWVNWIERRHDEHYGKHIGQSAAGKSNPLRGSRPSPALELYRRAAAREAEEAYFSQDGAADSGTWPALPAIGSG